MAAKVLLVEDDRALREALSDTLLLGGHEFVAVDSAEAALPVLAREAFSLVISDVNMPGMDGHQLLGLIRTRYPHLPVLLMTAYGAVDRAVEAMRQGAADYLVKPFEARALLDLVARHALGQLPGSEEDGPVALEPASRQLLELAARVARSDSTVLISGESGTGKEVLANYIHQQSPRAGKPFIAINCAAIPDNMLEATLFGHEKGSFTGAIAAQPGKFELADGGTILLDEISEMPLGLQAKLLRVLQEREVERVGARKPINLDIRVLATTNRDLAAEVAAGRFREDLYYRLSVFPLAWRPLRERPADILPLAERLLRKHSRKMNLGAVALGPEAAQCLVRHAWPGNVRELDNAIQRALILQQGGLIQPADLCLTAPIGMPLEAPVPMPAMPPATPPSVEIPSPAAGQDASGALGDDLRRREFQVIIDTLRTERGRRKEAAERLGISPRTLPLQARPDARRGDGRGGLSLRHLRARHVPQARLVRALCVRRRSSPRAVRACAPADNRSRDGPCSGRGHWRRTPMPGLGGDLAPLLLTPLQSAGRRQKSRGCWRKSHESGCRVQSSDAGNAFHANGSHGQGQTGSGAGRSGGAELFGNALPGRGQGERDPAGLHRDGQRLRGRPERRRPDRRDDRQPEGQRVVPGHDPGAQQTGPGLPRHHADAGLSGARITSSWPMH